jgi:hypothetical protein
LDDIVVTESCVDRIRPAHFAELLLEIGRNGELELTLNDRGDNSLGSTTETKGDLKNESS